jgi:hypothetical protein
VNLSLAPRRPSRVAAVALLLILHGVALELFLNLRTSHERHADRFVTLRLLAPPTPSPAAPAVSARAAQPPRALLVPVPLMDAVPPSTAHDGATPAANAAATTTGPAASTPGPAKLELAIPKDFYAHAPKLTPAQEAMQDPRSNRLVLTRQEQMDVDFGVVECIAWQRMPDGSIYRGPGHLQRIQGISTNPFTAHAPGREDRPRECAR